MDAVLGDWGNSRLRLWRIKSGVVSDRRDGPGMAQSRDPVSALSTALDGWPEERVILCGMAGARNALRETPYVPCPAGVSDWLERAVQAEVAARKVTLAAGLSWRDRTGRPDVMRGEETQIFGALALDPRLACGERQMVLPGTHSKWVRLNEGRITEFRTFITGELFGLLEQSTLHIAGDGADDDEAAGFDASLARATKDCGLAMALFEERAAQLEDDRTPAWARGFVSGLLIGGEIRAASPIGRVLLIADERLSDLYSRALAHFGVLFDTMNGDDCVIAGLRLLHARA